MTRQTHQEPIIKCPACKVPYQTERRWCPSCSPLEYVRCLNGVSTLTEFTTLDHARGFVAKHTWRFAKSMPQYPHWYLVREKINNDVEFEAFVRLIRSHGMMERWQRLQLYYLYLDGFKYWTMGWPYEVTTIINRAEV